MKALNYSRKILFDYFSYVVFPYKFPQHYILNGFYSVVFNSFDVLHISSKKTAHILYVGRHCFAMNIHLAVYLTHNPSDIAEDIPWQIIG